MPREEHERFFAGLLADVSEPTAAFGLADVLGDGTGAAEARLMLAEDLAGRVRVVARARGVSPATLFHLVWARVLAAVSGRDDVVFGTVLFGRMNAGAGADRVPGPFINTLPVRVGVRQGAAEAVAGLQSAAGRAAGPRARPAGAGPAGQRGHRPGSVVHHLAQLPAQPPPRPADTAARGRHRGSRGRPGADELPGERVGGGPGSGFGFTVLAVAPVDAGQVCGLLRTATEGLVEVLEQDPATPLRQVPVLAEAERRQILSGWNDTARDVPPATLPGLFAAQVARTPDAVAVAMRGTALTYRGWMRRRTGWPGS